MNVEFTKSFDSQFSSLSEDLQSKAQNAIERFIDCYQSRQFPKGLRVHKCGPFVSLSITMNYRIFILPIQKGIQFVFIGDHQDADRYLRRN